MTVKQARRRFQIAAGALMLVSAAATAALLSPIAGSRTSRIQELAAVRLNWQQAEYRARPLRNIDQKIAEAKTQIADFERQRLPLRDSVVAEEIGRLASDAKVRYSGIRYTGEPAEIEGLRRLQIDASVAGDYLNIVKFINALERDKNFFIIDSVDLAEQQGGMVRLTLRLETYLRQA